jgi:hypothetical protein
MKTIQLIVRSCTILLSACVYLCCGGAATEGEINPVLKGSWPGFSRRPATGIVISGNYAYVTTSERVGPDVFDLSEPLSPHHVGRCEINRCLNCSAGLAVSGQFAYVADYFGLSVIDLSQPADPKLVGGYDGYDQEEGFDVTCVAVSGHFAYVMAWNYAGTVHGLQVFDVSNPANPRPIGWCDSRTTGRDLVVSDHYAYAVEAGEGGGGWQNDGGLEVFDISDPAAPKAVGWFDAGPLTGGVAWSGNYAYLTGPDGLLVVDVSDPARPRGVGRIDTTRVLGGLALSGRYAYVAANGLGNVSRLLQVIDVSDPARPKSVSETDTFGSPNPVDLAPRALCVAVSGQYAYVTCMGAGLQVIDISDPASPQLLGVNDTMGTTVDVALSGNYAYLAEGYAGLRVIDISNAAAPRKVSEYYTKVPARTVAVSGTSAYVSDSEYSAGAGTVEVLDISNPIDPKHVGWQDTFPTRPIPCCFASVPVRPGCTIYSIAMAGNYVYVSLNEIGLAWDGWMEVFDVSDPSYPQKISARHFEWLGPVAASGGRVCYAGGIDGLLILEMQPFVKSISREGQNVKLAWEGFGPARLQRATQLANPDWRDVVGAEATNNVTVPIDGPSALFRLVKP